MATGRGASGPTKRDRREEARETARLMREEAAKKAKRRKVVVQSSVIVGVLAVLAVVGLFIYSGVTASSNVANPKNMISGGIVLTQADKAVTSPAISGGDAPTPTTQKLDGKTAHIQIWLDYQCPYCDQFETTNSAQMKQMMADGTATLEIHPVAILDSPTNNKYSTRSAAAASCVANYEPDKFFDINSALFANQPDEQTGTGLTDAEILKLFKGAGVESKQITDCVNNQTYAPFVTNRTKDATASKQLANPQGGFGTPTVFVNGERYQGGFTDATQFASFVAAAVKDAGDSGTITFPKAS
ncbi:DsbA family protein [Leifsonia aquatica]|uniref:DsbA family protein n=1 Tax=Leifsonia aquatica TaxID=144185 RepID=UPI001F0611C7|nr:thioredoxin domain-containing protein [Leifsonia aquatica]